jgi:hypothetical protein
MGRHPKPITQADVPSHSSTSSALARTESGIKRPINLATFKLMVSLKRDGCYPEHHAQARPKWNERYELIVRLDAIAQKEEGGLAVDSSKVHLCPNESLSLH